MDGIVAIIITMTMTMSVMVITVDAKEITVIIIDKIHVIFHGEGICHMVVQLLHGH
jgi:hypothetical protein